MHTPRRITVGSDGSTTARRAVEVATGLALAFDAPLLVVTVHQQTDKPPTTEVGTDSAQWRGEARWAQQVVADAADVARRAGVQDVRTATPIGSPGQVMEDLAAQVPGTLLVVGTVGLDAGTERLLGTLPHHLAHHASCDLLLVHAGAEATHDWSQIVLTTDGSDTSLAAARTGLAVARALDATPILVSAGPDRPALDTTLREIAERIDDGGPLELEPAVGPDVSRAVAAAAADRGLLVLGNRRMHGIGRLLGSVPDDLIHRVPTDILLVHTPT